MIAPRPPPCHMRPPAAAIAVPQQAPPTLRFPQQQQQQQRHAPQHPPQLVEQRSQRRMEECALTRRIQSCRCWQELRDVLGAQPSLNRVHAQVAATKVAGAVHDQSLLVSERLELEIFIGTKIVPITDYHMMTFRPWELAAVAWAFAMLEYMPPAVWLADWCGCVSRKLPEFTPKDLSQCLRACAVFHSMQARRHQAGAQQQWRWQRQRQQHWQQQQQQPAQQSSSSVASSAGATSTLGQAKGQGSNASTGQSSGITSHEHERQQQQDAAQGQDVESEQLLQNRRPTELGLTLLFIEQLSFEVAAKAPGFTAQGVSNSLWAYATLLGPLNGFADGPLGLATGQLLARASQLMPAADHHDASPASSTAAAAEAEADYSASATAPGSVSTSTNGSLQNSCRSQHGAVRSGTGSAGSLEPTFDPQQLSMMAWAAAVLQVSQPAPWHLQLGWALAGMEGAQPRHVARGLWALATLQATREPQGEVVQTLAVAFEAQLRCRGGDCALLANADIAQAAWALARLRHRPTAALLHSLVDAVGRRFTSLQSRELAMCTYALAVMGARPPPGWLPRLCYVAAARWHDMPPMIAVTVLASLVHMRTRPSQGFLDVAAGVARPYALRQQLSGGAASANAAAAAAAAQTPGAADTAPQAQKSPGPGPTSSGAAPAGSIPGLDVSPAPGVPYPATCLLFSRDPRVVAWTLWSLGGLAWEPPKPWAHAAMQAVLAVLPSMQPEHLTRALCGLALLQRQRPARAWSTTVISRLLQLAPCLRTARLTAALHALRRLQASPSGKVQQLLVRYCTARARLAAKPPAAGARASGSAGLDAALAPGCAGANSDSSGVEAAVACTKAVSSSSVLGGGGAGGSGAAAELDDEGVKLMAALAAWLQVARLPRHKCGAFEVWYRRRSLALSKLQQLAA